MLSLIKRFRITECDFGIRVHYQDKHVQISAIKFPKQICYDFYFLMHYLSFDPGAWLTLQFE